MRELTPTAVFSESPGVGGSGGMFPVPFTVGEKKFQSLVSIKALSRKGSP